jgi:hypothetical protein
MHNQHRRSRPFRRRSNGRDFRRQGRDSEKARLISGSFNPRGKNNFKSNQSASKLLERYKILAKEALSSGDKILSENYLQHVDHFERIVSYKNSNQNETSSQNTNLIKEQNTSVSNNNPEEVDKITKNKE